MDNLFCFGCRINFFIIWCPRPRPHTNYVHHLISTRISAASIFQNKLYLQIHLSHLAANMFYCGHRMNVFYHAMPVAVASYSFGVLANIYRISAVSIPITNYIHKYILVALRTISFVLAAGSNFLLYNPRGRGYQSCVLPNIYGIPAASIFHNNLYPQIHQ